MRMSNFLISKTLIGFPKVEKGKLLCKNLHDYVLLKLHITDCIKFTSQH